MLEVLDDTDLIELYDNLIQHSDDIDRLNSSELKELRDEIKHVLSYGQKDDALNQYDYIYCLVDKLKYTVLKQTVYV